MAREPVVFRVLDVLGLLACYMSAVGMTVSAIDADGWPSRILYGAVAVALGVFVVRATPVFMRDWRQRPEPGA